MPNIYLKVTIEKKWHTKNSNFLSLKFDLEVYFLGALTHADIEFSNILLHLKNRGLEGEGKLYVTLLLFLFWKELYCFKVKEFIPFIEQKYKL